ncbi:histidine phosphatase family protein [Psychromarinibacter sp. C21-152]|uniref:Histidine phosphatase family protein n=1 Tax=Psychromarinibacter sediminicola TaxID=3033385 RepID=A0AAE3P058_9RHOB|nr:histidine phosphatase family protein [Psychromarinibacter sediminicola]MDF0603902.1 histidine phosphatase family protein [Psychromarinibacter sediminicola]
MFHRRHFLALAAAGPLLPACTSGSGARVRIPAGTRLIILRHADREGEDLTAAGRRRAAALVPALDGIEIDAIYYPGIRRNFDTGKPLADARGLSMQTIRAEHPAATLMSAGAGKTIVWIGNKGNLHSIWEDLGAPGEAPLNYGDLYIVEPGPGGTPAVLRRRFGA